MRFEQPLQRIEIPALRVERQRQRTRSQQSKRRERACVHRVFKHYRLSRSNERFRQQIEALLHAVCDGDLGG